MFLHLTKFTEIKMKKILVIAVVCLSLISPTVIKASGIQFADISFEEARKKAGESGKLIFIDAYTTWCGPCKYMAKAIFTNDEVGRFYNSNFICLKMDMEKGEGKEIAEKYAVQVYPTFLFIDAKGQKVHQTCGSKESIDFLEDGKNTLNPENQLLTFTKNYETGQRDFIFLKEYTRLLQNAAIAANTIVDELVLTDKSEELVNEKDFELLANSSEVGSVSFQFLMTYREKYASVLKNQRFNEFLSSSFLNEAAKAGKMQSQQVLNNAISKLEEYNIENVKELSLRMNWQYAQVTKTELFEAAQPYIENFGMSDANELNNAAWIIFESYSEPNRLEAAANWAKQSIELKKDFANTDTYANLLFKLGKKEEALKMAKESLELGKKQEMETTETENLIKSIEESFKGKK